MKVKNSKTRSHPGDMLWKKKDLGIRIPRTGTDAAIQFFLSFRQINEFLRFVVNMAGHLDYAAKHAYDTLVKVANDPAEKERLAKEWAGHQSPIDDLKKHRQFLMEVVLVRHIENYLNYLSSLLREIFLARPEALRSSEKIELETILRHDSIDDLVRTITERKVESLSYSSFSELAEYFKEKFHIELVPTEDLPCIVDAIETRNISVHNRCIINNRFVSRTGKNTDAIGHLRELWVQDIEAVALRLGKSVKAIDVAARKRLHVKGHYLPKPDTD